MSAPTGPPNPVPATAVPSTATQTTSVTTTATRAGPSQTTTASPFTNTTTNTTTTPTTATSPSSTTASPPATMSPPSLPSTSSRAPPTTTSSSRTTGPAPHTTNTTTNSTTSTSVSTLPGPETQLQIAEARAALVASMSNLLDGELQSRATLLHQNAAALARQERAVAAGVEALRRDNDRLAKVARDAGRRVKETGNVQNWAEVLERDFLVLEETLRLVREGSGGSEDGDSWSGSGSGSGSGSASWSGSEEGGGRSRRGSFGVGDGGVRTVEDVVVRDGDGDISMHSGAVGSSTTAVSESRSRSGPDAGGGGGGVFAIVSDTLALSISEAMATSIDDVMFPPEQIMTGDQSKWKGKQVAKADEMDVDTPEATSHALLPLEQTQLQAEPQAAPTKDHTGGRDTSSPIQQPT